MGRFGTRTRYYLAVLWLGAAGLEGVVFELARHRYDSWLLLLGALLLVIPLVAVERTLEWLGRAPRKRWKRHDVEAALALAARRAQPAPGRGAEGKARGGGA